MIIDNFTYVALALMNFCIELFPDADLDHVATMASSLTTLKASVYTFDFLFPMDSIFAALSVMFTVEASYFAYKKIMWVIDRIPFI